MTGAAASAGDCAPANDFCVRSTYAWSAGAYGPAAPTRAGMSSCRLATNSLATAPGSTRLMWTPTVAATGARDSMKPSTANLASPWQRPRWCHGPVAASDLGAKTLLSRSQVSRVVDALRDRDLVARVPAPSDARSVCIVLTDAGRSARRGRRDPQGRAGGTVRRPARRRGHRSPGAGMGKAQGRSRGEDGARRVVTARPLGRRRGRGCPPAGCRGCGAMRCDAVRCVAVRHGGRQRAHRCRCCGRTAREPAADVPAGERAAGALCLQQLELGNERADVRGHLIGHLKGREVAGVLQDGQRGGRDQR